jgi:hypothetical protein
MTSKRLESILGNAPSATARGELATKNPSTKIITDTQLEYTRIVATIPQVLKDEIKGYIKKNKGDTETTIILRALKNMGFTVDPSWIVDKRTTR